MILKAKPLRVYDARGRERFVHAGQIVPAGWYDHNTPPVLLTEDMVVIPVLDEGNPYDQVSHLHEWLSLRPLRTERADSPCGGRQPREVALAFR